MRKVNAVKTDIIIKKKKKFHCFASQVYPCTADLRVNFCIANRRASSCGTRCSDPGHHSSELLSSGHKHCNYGLLFCYFNLKYRRTPSAALKRSWSTKRNNGLINWIWFGFQVTNGQQQNAFCKISSNLVATNSSSFCLQLENLVRFSSDSLFFYLLYTV